MHWEKNESWFRRNPENAFFTGWEVGDLRFDVR